MSAPHSLSRRSQLRFLAVAGALAILLTTLQTAQEFVRAGPAARSGLGRTIGLNAIDWIAWAPFVGVILLCARRLRSGPPRPAWQTALAWLVVAVACCAAVGVVTGTIVLHWKLLPSVAALGTTSPTRFLAMWVVGTAPLNVLVFSSMAGLLHASITYDELGERRVREAELSARATRAELNVLRLQLHPHFLFNALHTISSLMLTDVAAAQQVVASLGELLRAAIDHTAQQEVTLRDELGFVERYIEIQQARFRQRLSVSVAVEDETLDTMVPSFLLQPLVENAIRHGVERAPAGGDISIRAVVDGHDVVLTVQDQLRGAAPRAGTTGASRSSPAGTGVGLANIEARVAQLYGSRGSLHFGSQPDGRFRVTVRVPRRALAVA